MESLYLNHSEHAAGTVRMPGSKSITNRALLLAALARGATRLEGALDSEDTRVMRGALDALGVRIEELDGPQTLRVHGIGSGAGFPVKKADIFVGNSGTTARSLAAVLAIADGNYEMSGVERMHERPIGDLVGALRWLGARIEWRGKTGFPPIAFAPREHRGIAKVRVRGETSSQFVSAVLMALPWAGEGAHVEIEGELVSRPYVDLTLAMMERFGVKVEEEGSALMIPAGDGYKSPGEFVVEGDASSASYFLAAGALGGGPVRVEGVGRASMQGDVKFADVLEAMGAKVSAGDDWIEVSGRPPLAAFDLDFNLIPDAAMTAAVLTLFTDGGPCTLRNIASWRVKETDRIAAMATELRKFGARVQEGANFLRVFPPKDFMRERASTVAPVPIDTYDDHRMAMCFSLASFGPRPVQIRDPKCVAKTFPTYFEEFAKLVS